MTEQHEQQRGIPRSEWLAVGLVIVSQIFAFGGFVYTVQDKLGNITTELHELNRTVAESQVVTGKIVEHLTSVDRRLEALELKR